MTSTKPLVLIDGTVVRDLVVRFEAGRAVEISSVGGRRHAAHAHRDRRGRGAAGRVSRSSTARAASASWARSSTTRCSTRTPPSHIALGQGFAFVLDEDERERSNESEIHIDFMIGSNELTVTGITEGGERVPVLAEGRWQI